MHELLDLLQQPVDRLRQRVELITARADVEPVAEIAAHDRGYGLLDTLDAREQRIADEKPADEPGNRQHRHRGGEAVPEAPLDGREAIDVAPDQQAVAVRERRQHHGDILAPAIEVDGRV